jgi:hypothetical protein
MRLGSSSSVVFFVGTKSRIDREIVIIMIIGVSRPSFKSLPVTPWGGRLPEQHK